mgnify:CR=1 FL=1|jgi:hypothetical protein
MKVQTILKAIGENHLTLHQCPGYFVWTYDNGKMFEQTSTYVDKLSHLTIDQWIEDGKEFMEYVKQVKEEKGA